MDDQDQREQAEDVEGHARKFFRRNEEDQPVPKPGTEGREGDEGEEDSGADVEGHARKFFR